MSTDRQTESERSGTHDGPLDAPTQFGICSACGAIRAQDEAACPVCSTDYRAAAVNVPLPPEEYFWVRVEYEFVCRGCAFPVAVNHLETSGSVLCGNCGSNQRFPDKETKWLVDFAHDAAALMGQTAPRNGFFAKSTSIGRRRPRRLGHSASSLTCSVHGLGTALTRTASAGPGSPVCTACRSPLAARWEGKTVRTTCPDCGASAAYALPEGAERFPKLIGIIAAELRADAAPVEEAGSSRGGAVSITCPHCKAPLDPEGLGELVTCEYCGTLSRIPAVMHKRHRGEPESKRAWWLAFKGPHPVQRAWEARRRQERQRRRQRAAAERRRQEEEREQARAAADDENSAPPVRRGRTLSAARIAVMLVVLSLAIALPLVYYALATDTL